MKCLADILIFEATSTDFTYFVLFRIAGSMANFIEKSCSVLCPSSILVLIFLLLNYLQFKWTECTDQAGKETFSKS